MNDQQLQTTAALLKSPGTTPGAQAGTTTQLAQQSQNWGTSPNTPTAPAAPKTPAQSPSFLDSVGGIVGDYFKNLGSTYSNFPKQIASDINSGSGDMQKALQNNTATSIPSLSDIGNTFKGIAKAGGRTAADVAGTIFAPITGAIGAGASIADKATGQVGSKAIQSLGDYIGGNKAVQDFITAHPEAGNDFNRLLTLLFSSQAESPNGANNGVGNGAAAKPVAPVGDEPTPAGGFAKALDSIGKVDETMPTTSVTAPKVPDEGVILDKYNRAIRPTVAGKSNASQIAKYNTNVISGIKSIADNKADLKLTDSDGNITSGSTPKTVDQLTQAVQQTKSNIFKQYDALAKQAGEKGVTVDTKGIAKELEPVVNSKSLNLVNPGAIKYAQELQQRLTSTGSLDAETAQDVIAHYNDALKAFYKNPSYDTASKVSIDAMIANKMRTALDKGITGATGEQYQALKNQYGALSSIEKDVAHRAVVLGRQAPIGFMGNISNIASGAELVRGLITMNPADIVASGAIKGLKMYMEYLNNPDTNIQKMFKAYENP